MRKRRTESGRRTETVLCARGESDALKIVT
jgi:hypothetical protein